MSTLQPQPAKILVVEDNPADVAWLRHALDRIAEPYVLEVITDGALALRFIERHRAGSVDPEPCVILLDLHLPKLSGIEVLRAIKRAPVLAHVQVVILSGLANPRDESTIRELGAICRLKPLTFRDCVNLASEILAICKGSAPLLTRAAS